MIYTDSTQQAILAYGNEKRVLLRFSDEKQVQTFEEQANNLVLKDETYWTDQKLQSPVIPQMRKSVAKSQVSMTSSNSKKPSLVKTIPALRKDTPSEEDIDPVHSDSEEVAI